MTAHEIARLLLAGPDASVVVGTNDGNFLVTGVIPEQSYGMHEGKFLCAPSGRVELQNEGR